MSRTTPDSTEQYSPFDHERTTGPPLAAHSVRETAAVATAAAVAVPAAVVAASDPVIAAVAVAVVAAVVFAGRTAARQADALETDAAQPRSDETTTTGTVSAAD